MKARLNLVLGILIILSMIAITIGTDICNQMNLEHSAKYILDHAEELDGKEVRLYGDIAGGLIDSGGDQIKLEGVEGSGPAHVTGTYHASENKINVTRVKVDSDSRLAFTFLGGLIVFYVFLKEAGVKLSA